MFSTAGAHPLSVEAHARSWFDVTIPTLPLELVATYVHTINADVSDIIFQTSERMAIWYGEWEPVFD